jgi:hypothetical protein
MFRDAPRAIILVAKILTIEINPMNFLFKKHKNN